MSSRARPITGFILGKFMPLHYGHMHLIGQAAMQVDVLTVLVCSIRAQPIAGELRCAWVKSCFPSVNVQHCADETPSYPHEHPDFWDFWLRSIRRFVPEPPTHVFTSEHYGDELAARLGATHILVDLKREKFPVSGAAVRANPGAYWHLIPPCVQAYYRAQGQARAGDATTRQRK